MSVLGLGLRLILELGKVWDDFLDLCVSVVISTCR